MASISNIVFIGAGYVGGPSAAVLALHCKDKTVTVLDIDQKRIDEWNSDSLPIYEPGLKDVVDQTRNRNLFFSTDVEKAIGEADLAFICVNTPTKYPPAQVPAANGLLASTGYDLTAYESAARMIAQFSKKNLIVVEKSTVPVRTAEKIRHIIEPNKQGELCFDILSNPEFLAEGTAINDLQTPDRVLIGGEETEKGQAAIEALASLYDRWVPREKIIISNLWSAELSKLAANAFLAQRVSSINALSSLCEKSGANISQVAQAIGVDARIGSKFLNAGVGFGGSCFRKDLEGLIYLLESYHLQIEAEYWKSVLIMNFHQKNRFAKIVIEQMFGTVRRKKICVFGFSFKKDTGDIRESPAIDICNFLASEGASLTICDPKVKEIHITSVCPTAKFERDPYLATESAHALLITTDWDEFKTLHYDQIFEQMVKPAFIFDGRNILNHDELKRLGFRVYCIGKYSPR